MTGEGNPLDDLFSNDEKTDRMAEGAGNLESDTFMGRAMEIFETSLERKTLPEVVCLCGSTRFKDEFLEEQERLTLEGKIFLTVGLFGHADGLPNGADKEVLDELHRRKIDLADRVHVVNPGGYVGESTEAEVEYARETDTPVTWREDP